VPFSIPLGDVIGGSFVITLVRPGVKEAVVRGRVVDASNLPLEGAYVADSGDLVVPFDRSTIKNAPKVPHDHVLTRSAEDEIAQYYEISQ